MYDDERGFLCTLYTYCRWSELEWTREREEGEGEGPACIITSRLDWVEAWFWLWLGFGFGFASSSAPPKFLSWERTAWAVWLSVRLSLCNGGGGGGTFERATGFKIGAVYIITSVLGRVCGRGG